MALSDGGGIRHTVQRPIVGVGKVGRLLNVGLKRLRAGTSFEPTQVNGRSALIMRLDGKIDTVVRQWD
ncbi:hypothetical protein [Actinomadura soli]|uniref:hypothetical protein n=1 Tax=Actinomadura soli TaxID=2508997 RepID=UPI001E508679|nr:hypothetical protein [Actinomadura soli]